MDILDIGGVTIEGISACLPPGTVANDEKVAQATGILTRRIAAPGVTVVDLCAKAAKKALADTHSVADDIGAAVFVSFTQHHRMPCAAAQVQARLGLPRNIPAFDVSLACSGWAYGLYLAGLLARETGRKTLLLDGDVQSEFLDSADANTVPLLADGGTATVVGCGGEPGEGVPLWRFAFITDGAKGDALRLEHGKAIEMDGFGVFRFVATDVVAAIRGFMAALGRVPADFDLFVPHQPNVFMVRQLAKSVGFAADRTAISCDKVGNLSSASIPTTLAAVPAAPPADLLVSGFGGGLSISLAAISLPADCKLSVI